MTKQLPRSQGNLGGTQRNTRTCAGAQREVSDEVTEQRLPHQSLLASRVHVADARLFLLRGESTCGPQAGRRPRSPPPSRLPRHMPNVPPGPSATAGTGNLSPELLTSSSCRHQGLAGTWGHVHHGANHLTLEDGCWDGQCTQPGFWDSLFISPVTSCANYYCFLH